MFRRTRFTHSLAHSFIHSVQIYCPASTEARGRLLRLQRGRIEGYGPPIAGRPWARIAPTSLVHVGGQGSWGCGCPCAALPLCTEVPATCLPRPGPARPVWGGRGAAGPLTFPAPSLPRPRSGASALGSSPTFRGEGGEAEEDDAEQPGDDQQPHGGATRGPHSASATQAAARIYGAPR